MPGDSLYSRNEQLDDTTWQLRHNSRNNVILQISRPDPIVIDHSLRVN